MTVSLNPDEPIDFNQLRRAAAEKDVAPPAPVDRNLRIGSKMWPVNASLTPLELIKLTEVEEGNLRQTFENIALLVPEQYRDDVRAYILNEDPNERLDFNEVLKEFERTSQIVMSESAGRPTDR